MQVLALPFASRITLLIAAVGMAVHQQASVDVVSTIPHENVALHCEQWLISLSILLDQLTVIFASPCAVSPSVR